MMDNYLYRYEKEIVYTFTVFMILFNLVSLYFTEDLFSYDEMTDYLKNGGIKSDSPHSLAYLLFLNGMSNLLFVTVFLMEKLVSKYG